MSLPRSVFAVVVAAFLCSVLSFAATKRQASCTFTTFSPPAGYTISEVDGIDDSGNVVGQLETTDTQEFVGFTMSSAGKFSMYQAPKAAMTWLLERNDSGISVGYYLDNGNPPQVHGFTLQGNNFAGVDYPKADFTWLYGINQKGTVVGASSKNHVTTGFLLTNGNYTAISYAGAQSTAPMAVNDGAEAVGSYFDGIKYHGFVWQSGSFTVVDYPRAKYGTELTGVNNAGLIVGNRLSGDHAYGFLYQNNVFANVTYTGAKYASIGGINNNGVISGAIVITKTNVLGYTAVCK